MSSTPTLYKTIDDLIEAKLTGLHTMMPGKVVAVDTTKGKCDVQPLIKRINSDGAAVLLPVIPNCPIGFYRAGKAAVYLPLHVGDGVETRFCERSLDIWLSKGGTIDPLDRRKHNLSDAVAYPGFYDFTDPPTAADPDNLVVVNDQAKFTLSPSGKFKFEGGSVELLDTLISVLTTLIAAKTLDPLTGPVPSFLVTDIAALTAEKAKLVGLKL